MEACGLAVACCLVGSLPAALRAARVGGSFVGALIAATAVVLPLVALAIALSRAAGRGFRLVMGLQAGRGTAAGLGLWVGLMAPILILLGSLLKEKTSHRGLGGGTFGVLALAVTVGAALLAHRVVQSGRWLVERGFSPRAVATLIALLSVGPMLLVSFPLLASHEISQDSHAVAAALIDGVIFTLAASVAVTFDVGERARSMARRLGLPSAAAFMLVGIAWLSVSPSLGGAMRSGGGLSSALLGGLERWTDRDRDGVGSHFGGRDCDEGDPRRFPGADDPPGDGVDQNCDGVDGRNGASSAKPAVGDALGEVHAAPLPAQPSEPAAGPSAKPSIIVVTLDTVRSDRTSLYGFAKKTTPRLDALAQKGATFELAYAPASDSQRALLPIFSGKSFADSAKDRGEWPTLKSEAETVAERMKKAGYATAGVSSFQWLSKRRGFDQGFDTFEEIFDKDLSPERNVTGPRAVRAARAVIEKADGKQPLFLWVHLFDAHEQYKRHDGFDFGGGKDGAYLSEIGFVDKQLGDLVDAVEASKLKGSVAWVVFGSQGEGFDEHDSSGHGKELYEEAVRVPLVVALPGVETRRVASPPVSTADIPATVLALSGASTDGVQGASLLALARGDAEKRPPLVLHGNNRAAVIDPPLKLVVIERKKKERLLLFDLSADPKESKDLSEARPDDLTRLRALAPKRQSRD